MEGTSKIYLHVHRIHASHPLSHTRDVNSCRFCYLRILELTLHRCRETTVLSPPTYQVCSESLTQAVKNDMWLVLSQLPVDTSMMTHMSHIVSELAMFLSMPSWIFHTLSFSAIFSSYILKIFAVYNLLMKLKLELHYHTPYPRRETHIH